MKDPHDAITVRTYHNGWHPITITRQAILWLEALDGMSASLCLKGDHDSPIFVHQDDVERLRAFIMES